MKITTHGFRHSHRSLLLETGDSLKEAQDRLGHTDVKNTMNMYAHVSKKKNEALKNSLQMSAFRDISHKMNKKEASQNAKPLKF